MAKRKASPKRIQVERQLIEQAKFAKAHGLLSKQAKLGNGKLSRSVAKKVERLAALEAVPTYEQREGAKRPTVLYKAQSSAVKLPRGAASAHKRDGIEVFNGRILASDPKEAAKVLASGRVYGQGFFPAVDKAPSPGRKITRGRVEKVGLSQYGIRNFADLLGNLQAHRLQGELLEPGEYYSFTFDGYSPNPNRTEDRRIADSDRIHPPGTSARFYTDQQLYDYLDRYKAFTDDDEELFSYFQLYRLQPGADLGPTPEWVKKSRGTGARNRTEQDRRSPERKRIDAVKAQAKARREALTLLEVRGRDMEAHRAARAKETPDQVAERNRKNRERMRKKRGK